MPNVQSGSKATSLPVDVAGVHDVIERALERLVDREAARIHVAVLDGEVTLSGAVQSWAERRAMLEAVRRIPGVRVVHDHLWMKPYA
jgi:osmotically-inducible protein OsmY